MSLLIIDVITGGSQITRHPLIAVITCFCDKNGFKVNRTFRLEYDESRCAENKGTYLSYPVNSLREVASYIDITDKAYPDLVIVSCIFGLGFLNYYYDIVLNRKPLQYRYDGKHRTVLDKDSCLWGCGTKDIVDRVLGK